MQIDPYPQVELNKAKPNKEGFVDKILNLFSKDEKKSKIEPVLKSSR
jgi:hypothetical protein